MLGSKALVPDMSKVSIILPSLNTVKFLTERLETILNQTLNDWELIIIDSYSDDGSWELIQKYAQQDSRIRASQAPREGVYAGLNRCLEQARGEYVYIATSDDTMTPDCLEKMVAALDAHPDCDIAHCCLALIDEHGDTTKSDWYSWDKIAYFGEYIHRPHIRRAPHDGLIYCTLGTAYTSLTQLLIRKRVFTNLGLFKTEFGPSGDFEWGLRVSLVCNTVHVPHTLATWRVHTSQATQNSKIFSAAGQALWCDMIVSAVDTLRELQIPTAKHLKVKQLTHCYRLQQLIYALKETHKDRKARWQLLQTYLKQYPTVLAHYLSLRFRRQHFEPKQYLLGQLKTLNTCEDLVCLPEMS
jgi:glycosyltransferase involved in cell wall biosynthesis